MEPRKDLQPIEIEILEGEVVDSERGWQDLHSYQKELRSSARMYGWFSAIAALSFSCWTLLVGWWTGAWAPLSMLWFLIVGARIFLWWSYRQSSQLLSRLIDSYGLGLQGSIALRGMLGYPLLAGVLLVAALPVALWLWAAIALEDSLLQAWAVLLSGLMLAWVVRRILRSYRIRLKDLDRNLAERKQQ